MTRFGFVVLFALSIVSCSYFTGPHQALPPPAFADLSIALNSLEGTARLNNWPKERRRTEIDSLFARKQVKVDDFATTLAWLNDDPVRWKPYSEELIKRSNP
jgi:hypothetical protein